jgi:hypothetical protein
MKSLKDYLTENKKTYVFRIKVAGEIPPKFEENVKSKISKYGCSRMEKLSTTPIQTSALDFPNLSNVEVTIFEVECSYPVTSQQMLETLKEVQGFSESHVRIRNSGDPREDDIVNLTNEKSNKALLDDEAYKDAKKVKQKDFFGQEFNKAFLKDLQKTAKQRKKDLGQKDTKTEITNDGPDFGTGSPSPLGSNKISESK